MSKRYQALKAKIDQNKVYSLDEAIKLLKETGSVKFDASVEAHLRLGIDIKKSEQTVRGSVVMPHGTGKKKIVAAFVTPDKEKEAREAGAEIVGGKELIEKIKKDGQCDFAVAVAVPEIMKEMAAIAKTLGQKGLMPNPKVGTVTPNIKQVIAEIKKGKIDFKNDDTGNVHAMVGKVSFAESDLKENLEAFLEAVKKAKPDGVKGTYFLSATVCSAMGPAIKLKV